MITRKDRRKDSPLFFLFFLHAKQKFALRGSSALVGQTETRPRPSSTRNEGESGTKSGEEPRKFVCSTHSRFPPLPAFPPFVAAHNDEQCGNAEGFPESGCSLCRRENMNTILSFEPSPSSLANLFGSLALSLPVSPLFQL